jgi:hypothetical protein
MTDFRADTDADDIQLEEGNDLLLDVEESRPWKGSQQGADEIFQDSGCQRQRRLGSGNLLNEKRAPSRS